MAKTPSVQSLTDLVFFLLKRSHETHARAEALRLLLEKHGLLSESEFQPLYERLVKEANERAEQLISRLKSAETDAEIHQWLQRYEGTIQ